MTRRPLLVAALSFFFCLGFLLGPASAQQPFSLLVPAPVGGNADTSARFIGNLLSKELGRPVSVLNVVGGSGVIGATAFLRTPTDCSHALVAIPSISGIEGIAPVGGLAQATIHVFVPSASPVRHLRDFAGIARKTGRVLAGTTTEQSVVTFGFLGRKNDFTATPVMYSQFSNLAVDLANGVVDFAIGGAVGPYAGLLEAGKIRSVAVLDNSTIPTFSWTALYTRNTESLQCRAILTMALKRSLDSKEATALERDGSRNRLWNVTAAVVADAQGRDAPLLAHLLPGAKR